MEKEDEDGDQTGQVGGVPGSPAGARKTGASQGEDRQLAMAPSRLQDFIRAVRDVFERAAMAGETAVLLTGPQIRPYVRSIIERFRGQTVVMSQNEVHPRARLRTIGTV